MSLFTFSIIGAVASLVAMAVGFAWLGARGELETTRMGPGEAADLAVRGWKGRPGRTWFRGLAAGLSISGEKPTREIVELLAQGRWREGLPWAVPALGTLAALFFWPLFVGVLLGLGPLPLWGMVALFTVSGLRAAWPRSASG